MRNRYLYSLGIAGGGRRGNDELKTKRNEVATIDKRRQETRMVRNSESGVEIIGLPQGLQPTYFGDNDTTRNTTKTANNVSLRRSNLYNKRRSHQPKQYITEDDQEQRERNMKNIDATFARFSPKSSKTSGSALRPSSARLELDNFEHHQKTNRRKARGFSEGSSPLKSQPISIPAGASLMWDLPSSMRRRLRAETAGTNGTSDRSFGDGDHNQLRNNSTVHSASVGCGESGEAGFPFRFPLPPPPSSTAASRRHLRKVVSSRGGLSGSGSDVSENYLRKKSKWRSRFDESQSNHSDSGDNFIDEEIYSEDNNDSFTSQLKKLKGAAAAQNSSSSDSRRGKSKIPLRIDHSNLASAVAQMRGLRQSSSSSHHIALALSATTAGDDNLRGNENENSGEFVPPHEMIQRGCFSLGVKKQFRRKAEDKY
eukprot:g4835.t1